MNWKLFLSTFALIFIAELGDKTQLAAMARTAASGNARWTVFAAASTALVFSTLVAVLLGTTLTRMFPERTIRLAAATLFVVLGLLLARSAFAREPAAVPAAKPSPLTRAVLRAAAEFERALADDYNRLADTAQNPRLHALLHQLADEENAHLARLMSRTQAPHDMDLTDERADLPTLPSPLDTQGEAEDRLLIEKVMAHEMATAAFYRELSRLTPFEALKDAFLTLAAEEDDHATRLSRMVSRQTGGAERHPA